MIMLINHNPTLNLLAFEKPFPNFHTKNTYKRVLKRGMVNHSSTVNAASTPFIVIWSCPFPPAPISML